MDWEMIVRAILAEEYPRLPDPLPAAVEALVSVWAERLSELDPNIQQEQLGASLTTYRAVSAFATQPEQALLARYRRRGGGSGYTVETDTPATGQGGASLEGVIIGVTP